ncbi:MAG: fold metallo-hydrolase [Homoserinimonas sp.]|jgi:glyoxylase-like metal-dependent hydrolase (beta-lactamase superfamily II)|nr:fold metallo-hydrolase [Homoserinimonas sp.]
MKRSRPGKRPTLTRNVAPGVHRLEHAHVNCYLVEEGRSITIIDAAFPSTWRHLVESLRVLGHTSSDVEAVVLTHAHFDHVGFASRAAAELTVPVWVHEGDRHLAAHPYSYARERTPFGYPLRYPAAIPVLAAMTAAGALFVPGVHDVIAIPSTGTLDVPGRPSIVFSPGHTYGHCALHFPERDALLTGDALVTLDPYKATYGPQIIAGAATADSGMALTSLRALAETDATVVLPGHGEPWSAGIRSAVAAALTSGAS